MLPSKYVNSNNLIWYVAIRKQDAGNNSFCIQTVCHFQKFQGCRFYELISQCMWLTLFCKEICNLIWLIRESHFFPTRKPFSLVDIMEILWLSVSKCSFSLCKTLWWTFLKWLGNLQGFMLLERLFQHRKQ